VLLLLLTGVVLPAPSPAVGTKTPSVVLVALGTLPKLYAGGGGGSAVAAGAAVPKLNVGTGSPAAAVFAVLVVVVAATAAVAAAAAADTTVSSFFSSPSFSFSPPALTPPKVTRVFFAGISSDVGFCPKAKAKPPTALFSPAAAVVGLLAVVEGDPNVNGNPPGFSFASGSAAVTEGATAVPPFSGNVVRAVVRLAATLVTAVDGTAGVTTVDGVGATGAISGNSGWSPNTDSIFCRRLRCSCLSRSMSCLEARIRAPPAGVAGEGVGVPTISRSLGSAT
jgi:hypothetical protein